MAPSKLALQFQNFQGWATSAVNSDYVKIIDPPFANPFSTGVKTIGRVYIDDGDTNNMIWKGKAGAQEWWNRVAPTILARPWVFAWELPNEPQPMANWDFCNNLAAFTEEAARLLRAAGRKSVGGNISEGNPGAETEQERANLFCAAAKGLQFCDFWAQHCYWVPDGYPHKEAGYTEWHARCDKRNLGYATARGMKLPPRFITEVGIDGGIVGRSRNQAGYKAFGLDWRTYLEQHLKRFDDDVADEPDVLAAFIFVSGANGDWQSFAVEEPEARDLAAYINARRAAPEPKPVEPPIIVPQVVRVAPFGLARPLPDGVGWTSQGWGLNRAWYADIPGLTEGHNGWDYRAPRGAKVLACHDGVVFRGLDPQGFGQYIKIMGDGHYTIYAHLDAYVAKDGQRVRTGDHIGAVGTTGRSTGYHLHLGWKVLGVTNPGYLDYQNPVLGRTIYDAVHNIGGGAI